MAKKPNPDPGPGQNITTYTVDQLLERAKDPFCSAEQMYGEIERRARLHDEEES